jgi:hypothetical protein
MNLSLSRTSTRARSANEYEAIIRKTFPRDGYGRYQKHKLEDVLKGEDRYDFLQHVFYQQEMFPWTSKSRSNLNYGETISVLYQVGEFHILVGEVVHYTYSSYRGDDTTKLPFETVEEFAQWLEATERKIKDVIK